MKLWYHLHLIDLKDEDHDPGIPHSKIKWPTNNFEKLITYAEHHILLIYDQTKKVRIRILFSVFSDFYFIHMIWLAEPSWSQMWRLNQLYLQQLRMLIILRMLISLRMLIILPKIWQRVPAKWKYGTIPKTIFLSYLRKY